MLSLSTTAPCLSVASVLSSRGVVVFLVATIRLPRLARHDTRGIGARSCRCLAKGAPSSCNLYSAYRLRTDISISYHERIASLPAPGTRSRQRFHCRTCSQFPSVYAEPPYAASSLPNWGGSSHTLRIWCSKTLESRMQSQATPRP